MYPNDPRYLSDESDSEGEEIAVHAAPSPRQRRQQRLMHELNISRGVRPGSLSAPQTYVNISGYAIPQYGAGVPARRTPQNHERALLRNPHFNRGAQMWNGYEWVQLG